ncbi:Cytidine and deoxycytidylate deaminase [sediment metagenome]|uniref:Cytidine and deoxycytidylate deaminase n=1 Tax=sediment metagenome TaxID=749907 RepID=D9PEX4_9ZZZZ
MQIAMCEARKGIIEGQSPFGACIVKNGKVVVSAHNTVWKDTDATRHAEMNAIKKACKKLKTIKLSGCTIYSTTEPCPMCFTAIHWAGMSRIVYGATIEDSAKFGFGELHVSNHALAAHQQNKIQLKERFMRKESIELFKEWKAHKGKKY